MSPGEREAGGAAVHIAFGAAVWLFANELGLAAAGLTRPPQHYAPATHAFALGSHLLFGPVTDAVVRLAAASHT